MGRLVVNTFTSLDGVMQAPGMPDEDRAGGFEHGGWQVPYFDEESGQVMIEHLARFDALLLGRKTYEIFAAYWPNVPDEDPIAGRLNSGPKYVATRTLDNAEWRNSNPSQGGHRRRGQPPQAAIQRDPCHGEQQSRAEPHAG